MVGAGVFVAFPPAVAAAGRGIWAALAIAGVVAVCNAWSSARLAAIHPRTGGTYVYGTEQLGRPWGVLAGAAFVIGKTASLAVMAGAVGRYAFPDHPVVTALVALVAVTAVNLAGVQRSAGVLVAVVAVVLVVLTIVCLRLATEPEAPGALPSTGAGGVLEAAGLLFFAFAGYARLATLGGEVRDPVRTIPRAVGISVAVVAVVYAGSLAALVHALGPDLAGSEAPFVDALDGSALATGVAVVAVVSAAGSLLSLGLGVSRTTFAMADDGVLPRGLAATNRARVPWVAEVVTAGVAAVLVLSIDLTTTLTTSSVLVLVYYSVTNASAWTLGGVLGRVVAVVGLLGCAALVLALLV